MKSEVVKVSHVYYEIIVPINLFLTRQAIIYLNEKENDKLHFIRQNLESLESFKKEKI